MNKNYLFGIGMVLAMLMVFAAPAAADNVVYFDPDPSSATPGEEITVTMWLNNTDGVSTFGTDIYFEPDVVDITSGAAGDFTTMFSCVHYGNFVRVSGVHPDWLDHPAGHWKMADLTLVANNSGTSPLHHVDNALYDWTGTATPDQVWNDGTFTCVGIPETFTKSLLLGWNLISLPLAPLDNGTSAVLGNDSIAYDAVKSYNAATHQFEDATTMDPGIGYFVHVTTAGDWVYEGTAYTSISATLSTGLNCVGWTNETGSALPGALSSIDGSYRYVARWNTSSQSYEIYLPGAPAVFNDFTTMERGEGYFIAATSSCTLAYP